MVGNRPPSAVIGHGTLDPLSNGHLGLALVSDLDDFNVVQSGGGGACGGAEGGCGGNREERDGGPLEQRTPRTHGDVSFASRTHREWKRLRCQEWSGVSAAPGQECGSCGTAPKADHRFAFGLLRPLYSNVAKNTIGRKNIFRGCFTPQWCPELRQSHLPPTVLSASERTRPWSSCSGASWTAGTRQPCTPGCGGRAPHQSSPSALA